MSWKGRKPKVDDETLSSLIEEDTFTTLKKLSDKTNVCYTTVYRHLKSLGKTWKFYTVVPHELNEKNKTERVRICTELRSLE
jgi:transposase